MKFLVLAAGRGTRLGEFSRATPKGLIPINGQSSIDRILDVAHNSEEVDEVIVVGGYQIRQVRERLDGVATIIENETYADSNSLCSMSLALDYLRGQDFVVFNADVVYERSLLWRWTHHPYKTSVLVDELAAFNANEFQVQIRDARICELGKMSAAEISSGEDAQTFRISAEHSDLFCDEVIRLCKTNDDGYASLALAALIKKNLVRAVFTNAETWREFDTASDLEDANSIFQSADRREFAGQTYGIAGADADVTKRASAPHTFQRTNIKSPKYVIRRIGQCLGTRTLPKRMQWIPVFMSAFLESPTRALPWFIPLLTKKGKIGVFKLHFYGHEILSTLMVESEKLGMKPILLWGTLLGCIRENAFLRNDFDIDVGLIDSDYRRIGELKKVMFSHGYRLRREDDYKVSFLHPRVNDLWVDIDRLHHRESHLCVANDNADLDYLYLYDFPESLFQNVKRGSLAGTDIYVPSDPKQFLETVYGTWETPQKKVLYKSGPLNLRLERKLNLKPIKLNQSGIQRPVARKLAADSLEER